MLDCKLKKSGKTHPFCIHYIESNKQADGKTECGFCSQPTEFRCKEDLKKRLPRMSHSSRVSFISCRMKYFYNHIIGVTRKPHKTSEPIKLGRIWDQFIEDVHNGKPSKNNVMESLESLDVNQDNRQKLIALCRAYIEFVTPDKAGLLSCQYEFNYLINNRLVVNGKLDRAYDNYIVETKLSSKPDFYTKLHNIHSQISTYFIANPDFEYCIMEVTRLPQHRIKPDESMETFQDRIYGDILSRPSNYFLKYNRKSKTFGVKFWRSEFDLDETKRTDSILSMDIRRCIDNDDWYKNFLSCHNPGDCEYLPICETGNISEMLFDDKEKK